MIPLFSRSPKPAKQSPPPQPLSPIPIQTLPSKYGIKVAVEFGNSHSGVAFSFGESNFSTINFIDSWPDSVPYTGSGRNMNCKIRTTLSYSRSNPRASPAWGNTAVINYFEQFQSEDFKLIGFADVCLFKNFHSSFFKENAEFVHDVSGRMKKRTFDLVKDYLKCLNQYIKTILEKAIQQNPSYASFIYPATEDATTQTIEDFLHPNSSQSQSRPNQSPITNDSISWCFSIPSVASHEKKDLMRLAAFQAGLLESENPSERHFNVVFETDAATVDCMLFMDSLYQRKVVPGETILLCDAGRGKTSLTTYKIDTNKKLEPLFPEKLVELGAAKLEQAFEVFLKNVFGDTIVETIKKKRPLEFSDLMKSFENSKLEVKSLSSSVLVPCPRLLKPMFLEAINQQKYELQQQQNGILYDKSEYFNSNLCSIIIKPEELQKIFQEYLEKICSLIQEFMTLLSTAQGTDKSKSHHKFDYLFIVGGQAESEVLQHEIVNRFSTKIQKGLEGIVIPDSPVESIMRGCIQISRNFAHVINHDPAKKKPVIVVSTNLTPISTTTVTPITPTTPQPVISSNPSLASQFNFINTKNSISGVSPASPQTPLILLESSNNPAGKVVVQKEKTSPQKQIENKGSSPLKSSNSSPSLPIPIPPFKNSVSNARNMQKINITLVEKKGSLDEDENAQKQENQNQNFEPTVGKY